LFLATPGLTRHLTGVTFTNCLTAALARDLAERNAFYVHPEFVISSEEYMMELPEGLATEPRIWCHTINLRVVCDRILAGRKTALQPYIFGLLPE